MMEFHNERKLKAHKSHQCFICKSSILTGDTYIRYSGKYDGDFFDLCFHTSCKKLLDAFIHDSNDCEYDPVWIREWAIEEVCNTCNMQDNCNKNPCLCHKVINCLAD